MFDIDTINEINAEEKAYKKWERERKNSILSMTNAQRKQEEWNELYPKLALEGLTEEELNQPW